MAYNGPSGSEGDPWQQLSGRASRLRVPNRPALTRDGPLGRHRPAPEVIEHMLDDLEDRMRNYFMLYNRERDLRKESEATAYRLEQELAAERARLAEANAKVEHLDAKIRALVGQPLKIRETIDKIEVLYNQMDTLIQAFVGIGSCATLQSQSKATFLRLFLEYLYPCRDLDVRLNTLYTAIYASLPYASAAAGPAGPGAPPAPPAPADPAPVEAAGPTPPLRGLSIVVHQVMIKGGVGAADPGWYSCTFRYDHEPAGSVDYDASRTLKVTAKPLDSASGVIEFNACIDVHQLPPRVPNVLPKLVLDVRCAKGGIGSASVSIVDGKTLNPHEPWAITDSRGDHCGDAIVSVRAIPDGAKLPAVGFARRNDELQLSSAAPSDAELPSQFVETVPDKVAKAAVKVAAKDTPRVAETAATKVVPEVRATAPPKANADEPFQPKHKALIRKPLFLKGKGPGRPTPLGGDTGASLAKAPATTPETTAATPVTPKTAAPAPTPATSKSPAIAQPKATAPPAEEQPAAATAKAPLTKAIPAKVPMMKVPLKAPAPPATAAPVAEAPSAPKAVPKMIPKALTKVAPPTPPTSSEPADTPAPTVTSKVAPAVAPKGVPAVAPKMAPKGAPVIAPKGVPAITPKEAPAMAPKVSPKVAPMVAPKVASMLPPKVAPMVAPEGKAPAIAPKVAPKAPATAVAGDAAEMVPKTPLIVPKGKALGIAPKVTVSGIAPKVVPPKVGLAVPAAPTTTASETAPSGDASGGADAKKPLVPIVITPKVLLKKPLAPKKA
ncbi:variable surface lipoprotein [Babesia caballi]|uniref:Variable surface lipoprotein n=1 Tax=Babesia caballi TaxID=5871 RepID=A0AAV4LMG4_BABCB|nr:variable surface lipoprotein [Babesia caballi]